MRASSPSGSIIPRAIDGEAMHQSAESILLSIAPAPKSAFTITSPARIYPSYASEWRGAENTAA